MKSLFASLLSSVIAVGCATSSMIHADKRVRSLSIGLERAEVISIMGEHYLVNASSKEPNGDLNEVLTYKSGPDEEYRFKFINSRLQSWNRVHLREHFRTETSQTAAGRN